MTAAEARHRRALAAERRRRDEALCAWDFLTWGDTRGAHADFCIHPPLLPACSRVYDPGPRPEDESLYEGTGIGALYGLAGSEHHAWQLAGWTLTKSVLDNPPTIEGK